MLMWGMRQRTYSLESYREMTHFWLGSETSHYREMKHWGLGDETRLMALVLGNETYLLTPVSRNDSGKAAS